MTHPLTTGDTPMPPKNYVRVVILHNGEPIAEHLIERSSPYSINSGPFSYVEHFYEYDGTQIVTVVDVRGITHIYKGSNFVSTSSDDPDW